MEGIDTTVKAKLEKGLTPNLAKYLDALQEQRAEKAFLEKRERDLRTKADERMKLKFQKVLKSMRNWFKGWKDEGGCKHFCHIGYVYHLSFLSLHLF